MTLVTYFVSITKYTILRYSVLIFIRKNRALALTYVKTSFHTDGFTKFHTRCDTVFRKIPCNTGFAKSLYDTVAVRSSGIEIQCLFKKLKF